MDQKWEYFPRAEFKSSTAGFQWGLEWVDNMIQIGLLDLFKRGNKQYIKLNPNYKDDEEFVAAHYYKLIKYLIDQIKKFDISELNEEVRDLFKPKSEDVMLINGQKD